MAVVGERVEIASQKGGPRTGLVIAASDAMITVRWDAGGESSLVPGPGVVTVLRRGAGVKKASIAKAPAGSSGAKKAVTSSPAAKKSVNSSAAKKAVAKKAPAKKAPAKKAVAKKGR